MGPQSILKSHYKITTYRPGSNLKRAVNSVIGPVLGEKFNALVLNILEGNTDTLN